MAKLRFFVPLLLALVGALPSSAKADPRSGSSVVVQFSGPGSLLLLDAQVGPEDALEPRSFAQVDDSWVVACKDRCAIHVAPGTYRLRAAGNHGHTTFEAFEHALPPVALSAIQTVHVTSDTQVEAAHVSHAGRRTLATIVLYTTFVGGLLTALIGGAVVEEPALIGVGAGVVVLGYAGYYVLRKDDAFELRVSPLALREPSPHSGSGVTWTDRVHDVNVVAASPRGLELSLVF